jgi:hypothetical protein
MAKKVIKIGLDFDGVLAYNPLRVARGPVTEFKKLFLRRTQKQFIIPRNPIAKYLWTLAHESSLFPGINPNKLLEFSKIRNVELYLVTARYSFLDRNLNKWLKKQNLGHIFKEIKINLKDEQPHIFKERELNKLKLDYFIEDNWDIVEHLTLNKNDVKVLWITNLLDRLRKYEYKFDSLQSSLTWIANKNDMVIPKDW